MKKSMTRGMSLFGGLMVGLAVIGIALTAAASPTTSRRS